MGEGPEAEKEEVGVRAWAADWTGGTAVLCTQEYDVVPAPRRLEREVCTMMHAQLAFGARSRIRDMVERQHARKE
jgi:hypothetical protein